VDPRASLDMVVRRKGPCPCQELNLSHEAYNLVTILTVLLVYKTTVFSKFISSVIWREVLGSNPRTNSPG